MITKVVNVNLHQPIYERLTAKQGDMASRYLLFHLLDGDKPFDLTGRSVRVYARKPDKTEIFNDLIINDETKGYCTLELTSQCLAEAGIVKMELYISESGKVLTSIPFKLEVIGCINAANAVTSTNEFSALVAALSSLQDFGNLKREIVEARGSNVNLKVRFDNIEESLNKKVDKIDGKGLSTNDYTSNDKSEVDTIKNKADKTYVDNKIAQISAGPPIFVNSVSEMTDVNRIYVHSGDGYIYTYTNGQWKKTNHLYQSVGISDNTITEEKLAFGVNLSMVDNIERIDIDKCNDASIIVTMYGFNGGNIVLYPMQGRNVHSSGALDTGEPKLEFTIPNWGILVYDITQKALRVLEWGDPKPSHHILMLDNAEGLYKSGYLADVKASLDTVELRKTTEKIKSHVVLHNVNSVYIWNTNNYNDYIYFKFTGTLNIDTRTVTFDELCTEIGRTDLKTSGDRTTGCLYLRDGEFLVYDSQKDVFTIRPWNVKLEPYDNLILKNLGGKALDGQLLEFKRSREEYDRRDNSNIILDNMSDNILKKTIKVQSLDSSAVALDNVKIALLTDTHQNEFEKRTYSMGANVINEYYRSWGLDCVVNMGDNITYSANGGSRAMAIMEHAYFVNKVKPLMLYSVGNHDCNGWDKADPQPASTMISNKDLYLNYCKHLKDRVVWGNKQDVYYYYDIPNSDVRVVVLNSNDTPWLVKSDGTIQYNPNMVYGFRQSQLNWLIDVALQTDKHCMIVCHIPPVGHYEGMYYNYTLPYNYLQLRYILEDFKAGNSRIINKTNTISDFDLVNLSTSFTTPGNLIGVFSGHLHLDHIKEINNIKYVCTNCDATMSWEPTNPDAETGEIWTIPDRVMGEISQYCFDILTINTGARKVNLTRFGVGSDREFNY